MVDDKGFYNIMDHKAEARAESFTVSHSLSSPFREHLKSLPTFKNPYELEKLETRPLNSDMTWSREYSPIM